MLKLLPLLLLGGCVTLTPEQVCEKQYPLTGSTYFKDCVAKVRSDRKEQSASNQAQYPAQPIFAVQQTPIPVMQTPTPMQPNQIKQTECRQALGGGINCTTY